VGSAALCGSRAARVAYVSIRQHTSAYVSIRQHTSAYFQHTSAYVSIRQRTSGSAESAALCGCAAHELRVPPQRYQGAIKALLRRYYGAIKALLKCY